MNYYKGTLVKLVLIILLIIIFFDTITFKEILFDIDILTKYIPNRIYAYQKLKEGKLPLWTHHIGCGHPLIAEGEVAFFYPFNLLFLFLPWWVAFNSIIILHYFLAGWFMYIYTKELNLKSISAACSAIIFTFSGFLITHFRHINILTTIVWLPLIFYYIEKIFKEKRLIYFAIISIIIAIQFFAFSPQLFFYSLLFVIIYFLFKIFITDVENQIKYLGLFILFLLLSLLLISIQLLPSMELVKYSTRAGGITNNGIIRDSFPPNYLPSLFLPNYQLNRWELCGYVGIIPLILTFIALFRKNIYFNIYFFFIITLLSLFLSFGSYNILSKFILSLPVFNLFAAPARFLFIFTFCISILSAIGLNSLKIKDILKFIIIIIILLDLYLFNVKINIVTTAVKDWFVLSQKVINLLKNDRTKYRIWAGNYKGLAPNINLLYKIDSVNIYTPLMIDRLWNLIKLVLKKNNTKILNLLNVKYIFYEDGRIYINKEFLPRAFVVHKTRFVKNKNETLEIINSDKFEPREEVIIEGTRDNRQVIGKKNQEAPIKFIKYLSNEVVINVDLKRAGYLVLSDVYYPGWKCYVDGKETKIYIANYALKAVYLNKGKHIIKFYYEPLSFKIGTYLSLFGIIILSIALITKDKHVIEKRI